MEKNILYNIINKKQIMIEVETFLKITKNKRHSMEAFLKNQLQFYYGYDF